MTRASIGVFATLLAACAGNAPHGAARTEARCVLSSADSAYLAGGLVYRDCQVDRPAKLRSGSGRIEMGMTNPRDVSPGCMEAVVAFVVLPDGTVERGTERLVRSTRPAFGRTVLESVPAWRYEPALLDGVAVRQIVREERKAALVITRTRAGVGAPPPPAPRC